MTRLVLVGVALLLMGLTPARAKNWDVDYEHSQILFRGLQGDTPFVGGFSRFKLALDFDPAALDKSSITATIDTTSVTAGAKERDDYLPQPDWFDSPQFPEAVFRSTALRKTPGGFLAEGTLTVKGVTQHVALPFTLTPEGAVTHAVGTVSLFRPDFRLGEGNWANENYVKFAVDVTVDIRAKPGL